MNESILIVEDDLDTLELLENYFKRYEYQVLTAEFGEEAVSTATERPPDLVILDIRLPDIDGYEVCRRLTSQQRTSNIPIIFLTEKRERDSRIAGLQLGAVDYISKPFDIHELRLRVENALRRAGFRPLNHPVTALAGEQLLSEHVTSIDDREDWALIRVDLDNVAAFEAMYGFVARDDMLRAAGMSVKAFSTVSGYPAGFVAHLDTASFLLVVDAENAPTLADELCTKLQHVVTQFYPIKHLQAGTAGTQPLPRIEIYAGIVSAGGLPVENRHEIIEQTYGVRVHFATIPSES
jgi:DNA-binding response OmpR family regulator